MANKTASRNGCCLFRCNYLQKIIPILIFSGGGRRPCYNIYIMTKQINSPAFLVGVMFIFTSILFIPSISLAATTGYAWGENVGWIDFGTSAGAITVTDSALSGYAYGENIGWIVLDGITNSSGTLGGYAWGENIGWIDFSPPAGGVTINTSTGVFSGYAYGENIGWVNFTTDSPVTTSWRPPVASTPTTVSYSSSGGRASTATLIALGLLPPIATTTPTFPGCPAGLICTPRVNTPTTTPTFIAPVGGSSTPTIGAKTFTRTLTIGQKGNDVKTLQQYLNAHGFIVSVLGAGSPGNETTTFGSLTRQALIKFQKANGISPAVGYFGTITRAFIIKH